MILKVHGLVQFQPEHEETKEKAQESQNVVESGLDQEAETEEQESLKIIHNKNAIINQRETYLIERDRLKLSGGFSSQFQVEKERTT